MTVEPQEWLMIGTTKVVNIGLETAFLQIEGAAPVLRQAHTMTVERATTPANKTYLAVQRLYLGETTEMSEYHQAATNLLKDLPGLEETVSKANRQMAKGSVYGALREYRKLIDVW
ncbi:flagellar biosynthesis repressor FlbT [Tardiphaga sp.]|jgi:flagellar biosynthesis regulator FlbT|uniref:flagellar biosynthesis repressor FlbT n=1 Tax=Tardiphaga sp. TaxID=1926292 RepID=UPI0037DA5D3C